MQTPGPPPPRSCRFPYIEFDIYKEANPELFEAEAEVE